MARFKDRISAGRELTPKLAEFGRNRNAVVVGLPRGGMVVAAEIAKRLHLPLGFAVVKKIGAPGDPELAVGAIGEGGETYFDQGFFVNEEYGKSEASVKLREAKERGDLYRGNEKLERFDRKTVILVDDGIATGTTMVAGIRSVKSRGAKKVVVAAPVASPEGVKKIEKEAEIICLDVDPNLPAVGEFYDYFPQVSDREVINLLKNAEK